MTRPHDQSFTEECQPPMISADTGAKVGLHGISHCRKLKRSYLHGCITVAIEVSLDKLPCAHGPQG